MPVVPQTVIGPPPPPPPPPPGGTGDGCLGTKWLYVGGVEVANACRTLAYLRSMGHALLKSPPGNCCCTPNTYTTPAIDDAPWYDPMIPESADVIGVWVDQMTLSSPYSRAMRPRQWGGALNAVRWGPREIHLQGWVYTRSGIATEYAKQWLLEALSGGDTACTLPDVNLFRSDTPTPAIHERTARRCGLIDYKDDVDPTFKQCWGFAFDATLSSETPFLYGAPQVVFDGTVLDPASIAECNVCNPLPGPPPRPCLCGAMANPVRVVPELFNSGDAYCRPVLVRRKFVSINSTPYWKTATAIITIRVGVTPNIDGQHNVQNLRLIGWSNPAALSPAQVVGATRDNFLNQDPAMTVEITCLPHASQLIIDGTSRQASLNCGGSIVSAFSYLSSNSGRAFRWPEFGSDGLMLCLESDYWHTPPDASIQVQYVPRDRR